MTDYTITTNFGAKDDLPSGNAAKVIKGEEFTTEFTNIQTAVNTKADTAGDTFTGVVNFSDDVAVNTNTLFVDVSAAKVGIGTTSFYSKFHVGGNMTDFVYSEPAGDSIATFAPTTTGSSSAMNVNIGSGMYASAGVETARLNFLNGHGNDGFATGFSIKSYKTASATATDEYLAFEEIRRAGNTGVTHNERMRITATGNVGIGTDSPAQKLDVNGNIRVQGTYPKIEFVDTDSNPDFTLIGGNGAFSVYDETNSAERMRIDESGNLLVGKTSDAFEVEGVSLRGSPTSNASVATFTRDGANVAAFNRLTNDGSLLTFYKDGTTVGSIGTSYNSGATYTYVASQSTGIGFYSNGIYPSNGSGAFADNGRNLGSSTVRWNDIYATNNVIQTSDRNEKQSIRELLDAEQRVATACKGLLRAFKWNSAVEEKGDEARIHFGIIAQDLQDAFTAEGLDAGDYAMFINSTWTDEETGEERSRMGVRYSELLAFIISAI